jgi:hypothetical protein
MRASSEWRCDEGDAQPHGVERRDASFEKRGVSAPHDAGAEVEKIRGLADDDGRRRP